MPSDEKIRLIIVDDDAETRENIRKLLQFESDLEVIGVARTGREGCELAREARPDVVIMDINMPDMDGIQATETIRRTAPFTQVVILSVQNDPGYMRRAMLAGARDFLPKPPAIDELAAAIRRAGKMARDERALSGMSSQPQASPGGRNGSAPAPVSLFGQVITVYSPKGGTGCTTLATNLAVALHNDETPVTLVDGNLQFGDISVFLNEQSKNSVVDLTPRVDELDPEIVEEVLITHQASGMKVLPAPFRPENSEGVSGDQFVKLLNVLKGMYSYVVVDTSSTLTDLTLATLQEASDLVILVTTQEIPSIKNSRLFLDLTRALGIDRRRLLFVMNKFDKRIGITPEKVAENLKQEIAVVLPLDEKTVVPAMNRGLPFMINSKSQPVARSVLGLTDAIRQRLADLASRDEPAAAAPGRQAPAKARRFF
jgi:pilus assembly protein CpaE